MLAIQNRNRMKIINVLIPPTNDPLLTPYRKQINPKIIPIKRSLSILSNIKEYPTVKQSKIVLSNEDHIKINRSYQSLKKFKNSYLNNYTFNQQQKSIKIPGKNHYDHTNNYMGRNNSLDKQINENRQIDPQYLRLIELRKIMIRKKHEQQRKNKMNHSKTTKSLNYQTDSHLIITQPNLTQRYNRQQKQIKPQAYCNTYQNQQQKRLHNQYFNLNLKNYRKTLSTNKIRNKNQFKNQIKQKGFKGSQ